MQVQGFELKVVRDRMLGFELQASSFFGLRPRGLRAKGVGFGGFRCRSFQGLQSKDPDQILGGGGLDQITASKNRVPSFHLPKRTPSKFAKTLGCDWEYRTGHSRLTQEGKCNQHHLK